MFISVIDSTFPCLKTHDKGELIFYWQKPITRMSGVLCSVVVIRSENKQFCAILLRTGNDTKIDRTDK